MPLRRVVRSAGKWADACEDTAFVKDAKGWTFAEDSRISKAQEKDIVVSVPLS